MRRPLADLGGFRRPRWLAMRPWRSLTIGRRRALLFSAGCTCTRGPATGGRARRPHRASRPAPGGRAHQRRRWHQASDRVGDLVLITDHLNLTGRPRCSAAIAGRIPAAVRRPDRGVLGPLRTLARARDPGLASRGVYAALPGPNRDAGRDPHAPTLGADLVGMSTVLEAIAARHLGAEVLGISLVTNLAAGLADDGLDHAEVIAAGAEAADRIGALLASILPQVARA